MDEVDHPDQPTTALLELIQVIVLRLSTDATLPEDVRRLMHARARQMIEDAMIDMYGGDTVQVYVPRLDRAARAQRIARAIEQGKPAAAVAKAEGVSVRHARRLRGRFSGR